MVTKFLNELSLNQTEEALKKLHNDFKGIRLFDETVLTSKVNIIEYFNTHKVEDYRITNTEEYNDYLIVDAIKNNTQVTYKIKMKENKIYQVYETIKLIGKTRVKCIISYDGSTFSGYQKQPNATTIQGELEKALSSTLNEDIVIYGSGRTDKGVHAYNQVIHFDTSSNIPREKMRMVISKYLTKAIQIKESSNVHETFHSRYDIRSKEYVYHINMKEYDVVKRNQEWYPGEFNLDLFKEELRSLIGTHDFTSFTKTTDLNTIRTIFDIRFEQEGDVLLIYIKGNGFLRYMVRNIVGYGMNIAQNKSKISLLSIADKKDNSLLNDIAPAGGLYMNEVTYYE